MGVKYPEFVDIDRIKEKPIDSSKYRYFLEIPFENGEDKPSIMVVLKNPSKACKTECDLTISKVCKASSCNGYGKVYIFNLFPFRSTNPNDVYSWFVENKKEYKKQMNKNKNYLKRFVDLVDEVVFAWGTNTVSDKIDVEYDKVINEVKDICSSKIWKIAKNDKMVPLHGLRWCNDSKFVEYCL